MRTVGQRRSAAVAVALAAVWLAGFELAPNLHIGLHDVLAHHHHDLGHGDAAHGHDHGEFDHHHDDRGDPGDGPAHGQGSLAHRGVAVLAPPPPLLVPPAALIGPADEPVALADSVPAAPPSSVRQRGPPRA
jgi:hypothetical protein